MIKSSFLLRKKIIRRVNDRQDGQLEIDGNMEGTFLERMNVPSVSPSAFGEDPQLNLLTFDTFCGCVNNMSRIF